MKTSSISIYTLVTIFSLLLVYQPIQAQNNKAWEEKLEKCEIDLNIKGTSKFNDSDEKIALKYKDVELIWLHFDKSMKKGDKIEPIRVFLVTETLKNGSQVEYIILKKDKEEGINAPIFPDWRSKQNKFYKAECFDEIYKP